MPDSLTITTGSRLHFGPLSYGTNTPPYFGGVGMMIDSPGFQVEFAPAREAPIDGPPEWKRRIESILRSCSAPTGVHVSVREAIPQHAGLGSGTQLALAIAKGVALLEQRNGQDAAALAKLVDRGRRSAIGIHGFDRGGFLIDAGKPSEDEIGTLAARVAIPEDWRFVLVTPTGNAGLAGDDETAAFAKLPPMPAPTTDRLCRIALTRLLPCVGNGDFTGFSEALVEFGKTVGEYFAPLQGGMIRHPRMLELARMLRADGYAGIAQSSWGPTLCIAVEDAARSRSLMEALSDSPLCANCRVHVARPLNTGAAVQAE